MDKVKILKITGLVLLVLLLAALATYLWIGYKTKKTDEENNRLRTRTIESKTEKPATEEENTQTTPVAQPVTPTVINPTTDWNTYTDTHYKISFKYPKTWKAPIATFIDGSGGESMIPLSQQNVNFDQTPDATNHNVVDLTNFTDLASYYTASSLSQADSSLQTLKNVYTTRSASAASKLTVIPVNAGVFAATAPTYIESTDGKWRGVYYFANIGQAFGTTLYCVINMTDGTANVAQLFFSAPSDKAAQYEATVNQENSPFLEYVSALTLDSSEKLVNDFKNTFQYMAKSLKTTT